MDPDLPDQLFCLADSSDGHPEMGYVSRAELESVRGLLGLPMERDLHWVPRGTLMEYWEAARCAGRIVDLERAASSLVDDD